MNKKIHVYSTKDCPYCTELKQMLDNYPLPYEVTDVDENEEEWDEMCKTLNIEYRRNRIVNGAVVKSNGPANREIRTFVRNSHNGLLEGRTDDVLLSKRGTDFELDDLIFCIKSAALEGKPFTQTGKANGIGHHKERLSDVLQEKGINHLERMVQNLIDQKKWHLIFKKQYFH